MLRIILLLCIYIQLAVLRNVDRSYNREYEKGILRNDPWQLQKSLHSHEHSSEHGYDRSFDIETNDTANTDLKDTRRSQILRWLKDILVTESPSGSTHQRSFKDLTRENKDTRQNNVTDVLFRLVDVLEGLNNNLKDTESKGYLTLRVPVGKSVQRHKRDASEASSETSEDTYDVKDNATSKEDTSEVKDKTDTSEESVVEDKEEESPNLVTKDSKDNSTKDNSHVKNKNTSVKDKSSNKTKTSTAKDKNTITKDKNSSAKSKNTSEDTAAKDKTDLLKDTENNEEISSRNKNLARDRNILPNIDINSSEENSSYVNTSINSMEDTKSEEQQTAHKNNTTNGELEAKSGRRTSETDRIKEKLLMYLEDMFTEIAAKIQPLTRVKIALSPDNSYRIGYVVANIDTLEIKLKRLKQDMALNKYYWNDAKVMELFDQLKVTNSVVSSLMDTLSSYLPAPII